MEDKKKIKILLKVIERVYTKNPGMQNLIDKSMTDVCSEEGWLYCYGLSKHKFFVCQGQLMKIIYFIFSGDRQIKSCRILMVLIF